MQVVKTWPEIVELPANDEPNATLVYKKFGFRYLCFERVIITVKHTTNTFYGIKVWRFKIRCAFA